MRAPTEAAAHVLRAAPRTFAALLLLLGAPSAAAQDLNTYCLPDQAPAYSFGFADLKTFVGDDMGDPITCQYQDPDGTSDILQQTTTGTLLWRADTGVSIFTSGDDHWAMTESGPIAWSGAGVDPPPDLLAQILPTQVDAAPPQQDATAAPSGPNPLPLVSNAPSLSKAAIYWGAYVSGAPASTAPLDALEAAVGKKTSVVHWGEAWIGSANNSGFQTDRFNTVRSRGAIPMLNWGSWELGRGMAQPDFRLATIASGAYDSYIRRWASDARAWGHPFFLRFDHEMNGDWQFPWSVQLNGNQPADFVAAWRHVHDIFSQEGATNATWVWCPNISGNRTVPLSSVYPGDDYVDWTCLDGYNWGTDYGFTWQSFAQTFGGASFGGFNSHNSYQEMLAVAPSKPIMLGEIASSEHGGSKPAWISDMFETLPTAFPQIKALVWMDWNTGDSTLSWPLDSTRGAAAAFANGLASPIYSSNEFGNLDGGAIAPLAGTPGQQPNPVALLPLADTYTSRKAPNAAPGGNPEVSADSVGTDTAYLMFDLRPMVGKTVRSVTLRLHTAAEAWAGSNSTFDVRLVQQTDWHEEYLSYNNSVGVSSTVVGSIAAPQQLNAWYSIELRPDAVQNRAGGMLAIAINARNSDVWVFNSRESGPSTAPQLVIAYQ